MVQELNVRENKYFKEYGKMDSKMEPLSIKIK